MAAAAPGLTAHALFVRERHAPLLAVRSLVRRYANGRGILGVDLDLRAGEFVALTGPSGAGKSTLLRLLAGLEAPDSGHVLRRGGVHRQPRRGNTDVALIFQQSRLIGRADAVHNVLAGRLGHVPAWRGLAWRFRRDDWRLAFAALERVGLLAHAADRADALSGGEQQRLMIARALAQQPRVLLADEPVASLDPDNARTVMALLRDCADQGLAVVASLHQPGLAQEFAARAIRIDAGRTAQRVRNRADLHPATVDPDPVVAGE